MVFAADLSRITWHCVRFMEAKEHLPACSDLEKLGVRVFQLHGAEIETEEALFAAIAKEMAFPAYFGKNWNALDECLRDLAWLPAPGYAVFFWEAGPFWQRAGRIAGALVETWLFAAEEWGRHGVPFHLIFLW